MLEPAGQAPPEGVLLGPEMTAASAGVGRYLEQVDGAATGGATGFTRIFFGIDTRSSAWTRLEGARGARAVLASVDDPADPRVVWVSRKSAATIDPSAPSRRYCLRLDVARIVTSAAAERPWEATDVAPLRNWSDTYAFVPAEECGRLGR